MNILFINLPYQGHVIPTVGLVRALTRAGHRVTYLLPHDWAGRLADTGAEFLGYDNHRQLDEQIRNAFFRAEEVIAGYDLVLYEQFFFVGKHLAEKHGKKCARIFTAPATNRQLMQDYLSHGGPMGIFRLPLIGTLWTLDAVKGLGIRMKQRNWLDEIVENPPRCNLVYTLRQFQPFPEDFPRESFHFIGPSVYDRREEALSLPEGPVICISLGTILKGAERFFRSCMDAFREEPVTVVLAAGKGCDLLKRMDVPENVIVRERIPQVSVLKQASLFITHGGMNSVSEAMAEGVPMVVIPFVSDQHVNARQVEKLGLGRVLEYRGLTGETLRQTALAVLADPRIREQAAQMKAGIAEAPGNAGAVDILERFVRSE